MSSFAAGGTTVTFTVIEEGWSEPAAAAVSVRGFPGGDNWAISLGGQREITRTMSVVLSSHDSYTQLALQRGRQGTLTVDTWNSVTAVLKETNPEPPRTDGQVLARTSFVLGMSGTVYTPYVAVTINGNPAGNLIAARVESSFSDPVSRGYATFSSAPSWGHGDDLAIAMGAGGDDGNNNVQRFNGSIWQGDYLNSGPTFELVARGPLYAAQKYRNNRPKGITLLELTGGPATDEDIAKAVLDIVGIGYTGGNIGGTGITRGTLAAVAYTWRRGESALDYLQRLSKASLGYKLIETIGGEVFRVQVYGRPTDSSEFTFTEGADIFEGGHTQRSTFERYTAWQVTGFDYGDGFGPVTFSDPAPLVDGVEAYAYSSEMIEKALEADPGDGVSCEEVLAYIQAETDHEIVRVTGLTTPRDNVIGPGQTHSLVAPMLGITEPARVISVTVSVDSEWFTQTMEYIAGGDPPGGGYEGP